ncbi:unnamed protein product (macronuclear) [Paramecium tetraurelia]|uniref:MORN repeat protein n=1 Tax=Paramecium tetraurelia TaxID=5888 RepID=A0C7B4_PARTE|nr:uncharacterized protein GSPATT00035811001 [Paramecium tetraurelia]CAK66681.1 unnamed protein product [Paramecium tetraurelia]|eukprot:XP_001434078.1 hypothetical protein (macronuclear) [Paramecium tetraurelia strain d4-2]
MGNCCGQSSIMECHQQQIVTKDLLGEEYANKAALTIQSYVRGYLIRKKHRNHKNNSVAITATNEYSYSNKQSRQEIQLVDLKGLNSISKETNIPQNLKTIEKVPETLDNQTKSVHLFFKFDSLFQLRQGLPKFIYEESQLEPGLITRGPVQDELDHIYIGQWKDNAKWGRGIQYWSDGSYYEGYWRDNKQNGKGRLIHVEGDVYEGDWLDDKAHGQGKLTTSNGGYYVGGWINDKQNGQGKELWPDGASFEGHYVDGMKFGQGIYTVANGSQYVGEFADNCFCGFGTYKCSDGTKYIGYWKQNKMNGQGEFHWNDGSKYIGEFLNDLRDGFGTFYYGDGRIYKGQWKIGKRHGNGTYIGRNKVEKQGKWQNGIFVVWEKQFTNSSVGDDALFH